MGGEIVTDGEFDNLTVNNELLLPCTEQTTPKLSDQQIIDRIYRWVNGEWDPLEFTIGSSYQRFKGEYIEDSTLKSQYLNLFLILSTDNQMAPLLVTDQGFIVKKDIAAGGYISTQQGEIWLGHGRDSSTDIPKIIMMHSGDGYDTLYLKKFGGSDPAHLDLGDLTAHGGITVQKDNPRLVLDTTGSGNPEILLEDAKLYRSASGGSHFVMEKPLVVEQSLWCYDLASDNFGFGHDGNLSMGNGIQFASAINFWRDLSNNFNMDSHLLLKKSDVKLALISPDYTDVGIEFAPNNTWKMKIGYSVAGDFIYFWNFPASATKLYAYASGDVVSEGTGFGARINPYGLGQFAASAGDSGWVFLYSKVDGESYPRFKVTSAGDIWWGAGTSDVDVKLYRGIWNGHLALRLQTGTDDASGLIVEKSLWCNSLASTHFGIDNGGMFFTDSTHLKTTQADYVFDKYSASGSFHWRRCIGGDIGNWVQLMRLDNSGILYLGDTNNLWLQNDGDYLRVGTPSGKGLIINYQLAVGQYSSGATAAYFDGNHLIGTYSSALKYKENITDLTDTEWLYKLRPVEFDWKDPKRKGEGRQYGLIAEEVAEVYPQLVFYNDKGEIEGVRFESLGIPIIVELKKLRNRVAYLEEKLGIYNGKKIY